MDKKQEKVIEKKVEQQVRKRLRDRLKTNVSRFHKEFKKHMVTAVSAAFGFLIALSWREPIKEGIDLIIKKIGIGNAVYFKFISAIIVTVIAVLGLMIVSKWSSEK